MVLSNIVRRRDRRAAEEVQQKLKARQQELAEQQQETEAQQRELAEKEQALQKLAEHLPPQYRAELERLTGNGKEPEKEQ